MWKALKWRTLQFCFQHFFPLFALGIAAAKFEPSEFSAFAILLSISVFFKPIVNYGVGKASIARISSHRMSKYPTRETDPASESALLLVIVSLPILIFLSLTFNFIPKIYDQGMEFKIDPILPISYFYIVGLNDGFDAIQRALGRYRLLAVPNIFFRSVAIIALSFNFSMIGNLEHFFMVMVATELFVFSVISFQPLRGAWILLAHKTWWRFNFRCFWSSNKTILLYSSSVTANSLAAFLYARSSLLVLGLNNGPADVGGFEIAYQIFSAPLALMLIMSSVISPTVAAHSLLRHSHRRKIQSLVAHSIGICFFVNVAIVFFIITIGAKFIAGLFPQYPDIYPVLLTLTPLLAFKSVVQILSGEVGIVLGLAPALARITAVAAVANLLLVYILSKHYGAVGAAVSVLVVHAASGILVYYYFRIASPIPVIFRAKQAITASIVAALLTTAANNALNLDASHWQYALLDSTLFLMTFIASLALMKCFGRRRLDILVDIIALQSRSKR